MTNYIRSFPILLVLALLISACKTANKLAREETSAQAADSNHFSESFQSSLQNLFRSLYFQADSLVMWMQPCPAEDLSTPALSTSTLATPAPTTQGLLPGFTSPTGSTAHPASSHQHQAYKNPQVGKILIRGLKVSRVQTEGIKSSSFARDSLSARESHHSNLSEKEESEPPNKYKVFILFPFLLIALLILYTRIKHRRWAKKISYCNLNESQYK